ncbi:hypothetical protein ACQPZX_03055 [Actinoplanes sp. CA-142083]|uniref:hypothetical protein n=1 Tax=Actinoplanes sp. CA-142083 TaxID=3239903 RepID=UPI003D9286D1
MSLAVDELLAGFSRRLTLVQRAHSRPPAIVSGNGIDWEVNRMNRKRLVAVVVAGSLAALGLAGTAMAAGQDDPGVAPTATVTAKAGPAPSPSTTTPATRRTSDDHGRRAEPGDDHGRHAEPGDDHGGDRKERKERKDRSDRSGKGREAGDDHGSGGHGSDD